MFCKQCGQQIPEGSAFCVNCGARVNAAPAAPAAPEAPVAPVYEAPAAPAYEAPVAPAYEAPAYEAAAEQPALGEEAPVEQPKKKSKLWLWLLIGGGALTGLIVIIIACVLIFGGGGNSTPEAAAEKCLKARVNYDAESMIEMYHEDYLEYILDQMDMDYDEFEEMLIESAEESKEANEDDDIEMSYEIIRIKEFKEDDLEELQEYWEDEYDIEIEAAVTVKYELIEEVDGEEEDSYKDEFVLVKIDGKWYMASL